MAADKIVLDTPRFKGEFELDFEDDAPTALEWRWVKKISGYTLGTAGEGMAERDPSIYIAWAVVALVRAGRVSRDDVYVVADELSELPFDGASLRYVGGEQEADREDPPLAAPGPPRSTGASSESTSASPAPVPSLTGAPD